jgi:hypothetical protein
MSGFGKASAYLALFSEIGVALFVCSLGGALFGRWVDRQLGTDPIVGLIGFLTGSTLGAVIDAVLIARFLKRFEKDDL